MAHSNNEQLAKLYESLNDKFNTRKYPSLAPISKDFDPEIRRSLLREHSAISEKIEAAQQQLAQAQSDLKELYQQIAAANRNAWTLTLSGLKPGAWVTISSTGQLAQLVQCDAEFAMVELCPLVASGSGWLPPEQRLQKTQWRSFAAIKNEVDERKLEGQLKELAATDEQYFKDLNTPCPQPPCEQCGHSYCFRYHYSDPGAMSGWEIVCCSETCDCFHCKRARDQGRRIDQWQCCQCSELDGSGGYACECSHCESRRRAP